MPSLRLIPFFACLLPALAFAQGNAEEGRIKAHTCTGCHGIPGYNNVYPTYKVPKIGGQGEAYLGAALRAYQAGDRIHGTMRAQAQSLSDQDIADISAWLARIEKDAPTADTSKAPAETQVCHACHGADGMGTDPAYPLLAGQYQSYLVKALKDYRSGARRNPIMGGFASQLSDHDIDVLAKWYANQPGLKDLSGN